MLDELEVLGLKDDAIKTMVETGKDLHYKYRETSEGGLAKIQ